MAFAPLLRPPSDKAPSRSVRSTSRRSNFQVAAGPLSSEPESSSSVSPRQLEIGPANHPLEREADAIADAVVTGASRVSVAENAPSFRIQRARDACEKDKDEMLRKSTNWNTPARTLDASMHSNISSLRRAPAPGLPQREYFESRFGHSFADLRVHDDTKSAALASALGANAFTVGRDIFFGAGQLDVSSTRGHRLVAHELTHTLQQVGQRSLLQRTPSADTSEESDPREKAGTACTAALQTEYDKARDIADDLLGQTINKLGTILGRYEASREHESIEIEPLPGNTVTGRGLRNAFGSGFTEVEGQLLDMSVASLIDVYQTIKDALPNIAARCIGPEDSVYDEGCPPFNAGFSHEGWSTFFICAQENETTGAMEFPFKGDPKGAELVIHEVSHAVLGAGHDGISDPGNTDTDFYMFGDCTVPMPLSTVDAINNAYALEAFISCTVGSDATEFQKALEREEASAADSKYIAKQVAALGSRRRRGAAKFRERMAAKKYSRRSQKNLQRARDLMLLDRHMERGFVLSQALRLDVIDFLGGIALPYLDWTSELGYDAMFYERPDLSVLDDGE